MQDHHADQKANERLAVASGWKRLWDEHRVGPVEARRHRRWSQAGLVGVDHDGEERWKLERPCICDIPCTSELLVKQLSFFCLAASWLLFLNMRISAERCDLLCGCVCVLSETHFIFLPSVLPCMYTTRQLLVSGP